MKVKEANGEGRVPLAATGLAPSVLGALAYSWVYRDSMHLY